MLVEGSEKDVEDYVTGWLEDLLNISNECVKRGESVENKFADTMKLLQQLSEACTFAQRDADKKKIDIEQEKIVQMEQEKQHQETKLKRIKEYEKMEKHWEKQMEFFEKQMESDSSLAAKTLSNCVQASVEAIAFLPLGFTKLGGGVIGSSYGYVKKSATSLYNWANSRENTDDAEDLFTEIPKLRQCAVDIEEYSKLLVLLHQPGDKEQLLSEEVSNAKSRVNNIMEQLKGYNGVQRPQLDKFKEKSLKILEIIASKMDVANPSIDHEQLKYLNNELESAITEIEHYFAARGVAVPFNRAPNIDESSSNNRLDAVADHGKNYRYRVDVARTQLEAARFQYQEKSRKLEETNEKITQTIAEIAKLNIRHVNFTQIRELLNKSALALEQVHAQWSKLVDFFNRMSSLISCCMHRKISKFQKDSNKLRVNDIQRLHSDLLFKNASNAHLFATEVCKMSSIYMEISKKHIMGPVASLGELMILDPEKDADRIEEMKITLTERMTEATADIAKIVHQRMGSFEQRVDARLEQFKRELDKLPPPAPEHPMITAAKEKAEREARAHQKVDHYFD